MFNQVLQKCFIHLKEQKPFKISVRDYFGFPLEITTTHTPLKKICFEKIIHDDSNYIDINYLTQKLEEFLNLKIEINLKDSSYKVDVIFENEIKDNQGKN